MLLVTGASGYIGSSVLRRLVGAVPVQELVALARNGDKARPRIPPEVAIRIADYDDPAALDTALRGVNRMLFIASDGEARGMMRHHANVIRAAAMAKVKHIVFTSITDIDASSPFYYTPVYREAERLLTEAGMDWTLLRCGLYADFVHGQWLAPALPVGTIALPAGDAQIAPVSRDDIAAAAVAVLTSDGHAGKTYRLAGSQAYGFAEIAAAANQVLQAKIGYTDCPPADYLLQAWKSLPDPWPQAFSSLLASIRDGRYAATTDDITTLIGRSAETFESFLQHMPARQR